MRTDKVLTPDDVAVRLDRAVVRAARVLQEIRQTPGLYEAVRANAFRHTLGAAEELMVELDKWWTDPSSVKWVREQHADEKPRGHRLCTCWHREYSHDDDGKCFAVLAHTGQSLCDCEGFTAKED